MQMHDNAAFIFAQIREHIVTGMLPDGTAADAKSRHQKCEKQGWKTAVAKNGKSKCRFRSK